MNQSSATLYNKTNPGKAKDCILRYQETDNVSEEMDYKITYLGSSQDFIGNMLTPIFENSVLKHALKNLWNAYQYSQEYNSYLLNLCTKEEFLKKAQSYAVSFEDIDKTNLSFASELILQTLNQPMTSAEISLLLNVDHKKVENSCSGLLEYNPDNNG